MSDIADIRDYFMDAEAMMDEVIAEGSEPETTQALKLMKEMV
jgi:hypothetical protein